MLCHALSWIGLLRSHLHSASLKKNRPFFVLSLLSSYLVLCFHSLLCLLLFHSYFFLPLFSVLNFRIILPSCVVGELHSPRRKQRSFKNWMIMDATCYWMRPKKVPHTQLLEVIFSLWAYQIYLVLQVDYVLTSHVFMYWHITGIVSSFVLM